MTTWRLALVGALVAVGGCGPDGDEHERRGDRAYAEQRFADAAVAYRQSVESDPDPDVWAKLGAASLRQSDYAMVAEAYGELAGRDALRVPEAVQGLDLAAQQAEREGDFQGLRAVLVTLRSVAPEWASGRYALTVMRHVETTPEERLVFLPLAAAASPDRRTADSLLGGYAEVLRTTDACPRAIRVYRSVLRRTESPELEDSLLLGRSACAYELGLEWVTEEPWTAEGWFLESIDAAPETEVGRLALIGLGQARANQGDLIGAALAYQAAIQPGDLADSITIRAMEHLNEIAAAPPVGDSVETTP